MPRVSVIIPTHNRADLLRPAILSVLAQTFQDLEIVVVDDASHDDTADVVASFKDARISYKRHTTAKQVAEARNTGIRHSSGELIAFLDDDDQWLPTKLAEQVKTLDDSAPVVGAVYTAFAQVDLATNEVLGTIAPGKRGHILHELRAKNWIGTASTVCVRRQCFEEVGLFDEAIAFGEEYDMWIRIAHSFDFRYIDEALVKYGVHAKRLSTNHAAKIRGLLKQLEKHDTFFAADHANLSRRYVSLGWLYCHSGDARKGRQAFVEAIRRSPMSLKPYLYLGLGLLGAPAFRRVSRPGRGL